WLPAMRSTSCAMGPLEEAVYSTGGGGALLLPFDSGSVAPQTLEVVVLALLLREHVDHDVHVVEEDPLCLGLALAPEGLHPGLPEGLLDLLDDRLDLPVARARCDHEEVRDHDQVVDVQDHDVGRLLGPRRARG